MKIIKLSAAIFAISLFLMACNTNQPQQTAVDPNQGEVPLSELPSEQDDYWAKDNLDLQRVGPLLERAQDPQDFERMLNSQDGINNLDLNGDGYADYISVSEFDDRDDNQRGLSLFSRFGPELIQEIATIVFDRVGQNGPGARVLLRGNEQIYGDNNYYETNWQDRTLGLVSTLFGNRAEPYRSPYYYDNYPNDYQVYQIVETPVYRTRIVETYSQPVFIQIANPADFRVMIKSPYQGKWFDKVYARLLKPTKEQKEFKIKNPHRPEFVRIDNGRRGNDPFRSDDHPRGGNKSDREDLKLSKPDKIEREKAPKPEQAGKGRGEDRGKGKDNGKGHGGDHDNGKGKGKGKN